MKTKEIQKLSYKSLIFLSSFFGLLSFLILPSWSRRWEEERLIDAKRHAEVLGYQVFEIYREAANASAVSEILSSRSVASLRTNGSTSLDFRETGSIGSDPWGQPYRYRVLSSSPGQPMRVHIWSAGPNKAFETKDEPSVAAETYVGDDVGIVLAMNPAALQE